MNTFRTLSLPSLRARRGDRPACLTAVAACFATLLLSVIGAQPAAAQLSGSIQTTLPDGTTVNGNIYASKAQVFLTAGPQNQKASGLPDGRYYLQVTDPSGSALLSNDPAACRQVVVSSGRLAGAYDPVTQSLEPAGTALDTANCEHASIVPSTTAGSGAVPVQVGGPFRVCPTGATSPDMFCDTPNPGGEYKVWLIAQSSALSSCSPTVNPDGVSLSFDQKCAKTDNFKLALPAVSHVVACKFNDANGNGVLDPGELMISGWPITATVPSTSYVTLRSDNQAGTSVTANTDSTGCVSFAVSGIPGNIQATVSITEASELRWTQTAPANGSYDASGKPTLTGPTSVSGAVPSTGVPASGGIITVNLGPGVTVTAPNFGDTDAECPDCSILGTVTVVNTATPNKQYIWGIAKSVDRSEIDNVMPGGSAVFNYTVSVTHSSYTDSLLTGTITLINGDGSNPSVMLNVTDAMTDSGVCLIKDPNSGLYVPQVMMTLNSFTETSLSYRCSLNDFTPPTGTNTATASNASNTSVQYIAAAPYDFSTATAVADGSVTITDTLKGTLGTMSFTDANPKTFSYPYTFTGDPAGTCTLHNNIATYTTDTTAATLSAGLIVKVCVNTPVTITTTPNPASVTLGTSPVTLKDSATLSGGVNPTGKITFTLVYQGQVVDTEMVTVNGDGTYTTPTGYTLPGTGAVAGTYQWNASYSGDASNAAVSESGNAAEQVAVGQAAVSMTGPFFRGQDVSSPNLPAISVNLAGGYHPTGNLTLIIQQFNSAINNFSTVCSLTATVNGNGAYSFPTVCQFSNDDGSLQLSVNYGGDANNGSSTIQLGVLFALP
jgi:hypothetical protein